METVHPQGLVRDSLRQLRHSVDAIPLGQLRHISKERVEVRHTLGVEQAGHVLIPTIDATIAGIEAKSIRHTLVHGAICRFPFAAHFRLFGQHIEAEVATFLQEFFQLGGHRIVRLSGCLTLHGFHTCRCLIYTQPSSQHLFQTIHHKLCFYHLQGENNTLKS